MICPTVPGRSINTRSEEGTDTVTTAIKTLGAGLAPVRLRVRVPAPHQVPTAAGMIPSRAPTAKNTTVAKTAAVSATKHPPANARVIVTQTLRVPFLAHGLLWTMGTISWARGSARKPRRSMTLGWRGRRTNGSQPRSEGGLRLSVIDISGILRNHPRTAFGSKVRSRCLPFSWSVD